MNTASHSQLLPWSKDELEEVLRDILSHGVETAKVDAKTELETATNEAKAELLKDISAIANTYGTEYHDHGFLIYGASRSGITGIKQTETDTDKLQSHLEQLLRTYIATMPQIYVIGFTDATSQWGVIVIPPRNTKPHMFVKELQCQDHRRSRKRGDWFVRRGSTTDVGLPEDLATITQRQTDALLEPVRENMRLLQSRIGKIEDQYNTALFSLVQQAVSGAEQHQRVGQATMQDAMTASLGTDLAVRLRQRLRGTADRLETDLLDEAMRLAGVLAGSSLPWDVQPITAAGPANRALLEQLEEHTSTLIRAVTTIMLDDRNGLYTDSLIRAFRMVAQTGAPTGVTYTQPGVILRDYPLALLIYAAFVAGTMTLRADVLKRILTVPVRERAGRAREPLAESLVRMRRAKELFNTAFETRYCEPMPLRIRQVLASTVGNRLIPEAESFFCGEFVLALTLIDHRLTQKDPSDYLVPLSGLYLYTTEANDTITNFLSEPQEWLTAVYRNPLPELLRLFDANAHKAIPFECAGTGLYGLQAAKLYESTAHEQ